MSQAIYLVTIKVQGTTAFLCDANDIDKAREEGERYFHEHVADHIKGVFGEVTVDIQTTEINHETSDSNNVGNSG